MADSGIGFADAAMASLGTALGVLFSALPKVLGFVVILVVGWLVASLIAKALGAVLRGVHFNDAAERTGLSDFVRQAGIQTDAAGVIAAIGKWFIRLITLVIAFDALGLPAVSDVLRQLLLWLPNLVVALVVLVVAGLLADALSKIVRGAASEAGFAAPDRIATIAKSAVWIFAVVVALNQLGIAQTLINTLLIGVIGAFALAIGLAFGLGGRDAASEMVRDWRTQARNAKPKMERASQAVAERAKEQARDASGTRDSGGGVIPGVANRR